MHTLCRAFSIYNIGNLYCKFGYILEVLVDTEHIDLLLITGFDV